MSKKRFGTLFQRILDKFSDVAYRSPKIVQGEKVHAAKKLREQTHQGKVIPQPKAPPASSSKLKQTSDRGKDAVVEKIPATPRIQKDPTPRYKEKKKVNQQPDQNGQFFKDIPENAAQFDSNPSASKLDIVIGLDFGTSSTKAVIHAPYYAGNPAFAVPFGNLAHNSLKYLLPSRLYISNDGYCSLAPFSDASTLTDIKIGLMQAPDKCIEPASGPPCDASATEVATAYLASVLRYVRCWFIANKREAFGRFSINWSCNFGLPAATNDDASSRETFDMVVRAAWRVSKQSGQVTLGLSKQAIEKIKHSKSEDENRWCELELIPEVIAEVTGYAKSHLRNEGLHLLVDIGASTLDVCSFNLHKKDGDDVFSIFTADVELLGARRLHFTRLNGAKEAIDVQGADIVDKDDPMSMIPDIVGKYIPKSQEIINKTTDAENNFKNECKRLLYKTLFDLWKRRDPYSRRWSESLPVFVCGGAATMQVYQDVVSSVDEWLRKYISSSQGARIVQLPKPESLEADIDNNLYHRLAVAWGLSHESFNIGKYVRPSEIDDILDH